MKDKRYHTGGVEYSPGEEKGSSFPRGIRGETAGRGTAFRILIIFFSSLAGEEKIRIKREGIPIRRGIGALSYFTILSH